MRSKWKDGKGREGTHDDDGHIKSCARRDICCCVIYFIYLLSAPTRCQGWQLVAGQMQPWLRMGTNEADKKRESTKRIAHRAKYIESTNNVFRQSS